MREIKPENRLDPEESKELIFPIFSIGLKHLPEAEKWDFDDEYEVSLKLRMKRLSKLEADGERSEGSVDFEIIGIGVDRDKQMREIDKQKEDKGAGSYRER